MSGPEIIHKFYGESEAHLRKIFEEATRKGPSIIFLDEIDAIAPQRENVVGEVEKRVVAQLLALMDGLTKRQNVIVIGATNIPNAIDPALRRPGRFDREIAIPIPDRNGRLAILEIHSRGMPFNKDVDLNHLAEITHGFVGADLEALCREAAMICLRDLITDIDFSLERIPYDRLAKLEVHMEHFMGAMQDVEPSAIREVFVEIPNVRWQDLGGLAEVRERLQEAVEWPLQYPQLFERVGIHPPKGILLAGRPGCGKTLLAKAIATESRVNFISVKGPALLSKYVGDSERRLRDVFRKARQAAPCIIFFDEIDALIPARSSGLSDSPVTDRVLSQFLAELDGIEELKGVLVLAATNRPDRLDPAVLRPGRFDEMIEIPLPDAAGRREIFEIHLRGKPLAKKISVEDLAARTEGRTGADIASICNLAALKAVRRAVAAFGIAFCRSPAKIACAGHRKGSCKGGIRRRHKGGRNARRFGSSAVGRSTEAMNQPEDGILYLYGVARHASMPEDIFSALLQGSAPSLHTAGWSSFFVKGVDNPKPFIWRDQDIAAVLSRVATEEFCGPAAESNLKDLAWICPRVCWHQVVVDQVVPFGPILPARFGTLFSSLQSLAGFLQEHREIIGRFLDRVTDQDEWAVKGRLDLAHSEEGNGEALPAQIGHTPSSPGLAYLQTRRLKIQAKQELNQRLTEACNSVERELTSLASEFRRLRVFASETTAANFETIVNWAFLLPKTAVPEFRTRIDRANAKHSQFGLSIELSGPWPPYSFCPSLGIKS